MSNAKPLTQRDWERFGQAAMKWAGEMDGAQFRAEVEDIVRARLKLAWKQGFRQGWREGVTDANDCDHVKQQKNPWQ